ncbi:MAG: diacylglycerol kinase family protein [Bacteroidales bacterium]
MADNVSEWLVLINPQSGNNRGLQDWGKISSLLQEYHVDYHHRFTDYALHGVKLVQELVQDGFRKVIIAGGDGFLNEVINGLFTHQEIIPGDITIGMIPVGTGNDWFRSLNIAMNYESAIQAIKKEKTCMHDIGKVYYQFHGEECSSYFINICGLGFDAAVNRKVNSDRGPHNSGTLKYQYHLFTTLVSYEPTRIRTYIDNQAFEEDVFSMAVGIAQYNGGGMRQLPNAKVDDGLFDITVIKKISKLKVIRNVKHLYDGSFINMPEILTFTGKEISIDSEPMTWLEADGESLGHTPFRFKMIPNAIRVITGK